MRNNHRQLWYAAHYAWHSHHWLYQEHYGPYGRYQWQWWSSSKTHSIFEDYSRAAVSTHYCLLITGWATVTDFLNQSHLSNFNSYQCSGICHQCKIWDFLLCNQTYVCWDQSGPYALPSQPWHQAPGSKYTPTYLIVDIFRLVYSNTWRYGNLLCPSSLRDTLKELVAHQVIAESKKSR